MNRQNDKFKNDFYKQLVRYSIHMISFCDGVRNSIKLRSVADQLVRSSTSIGANIVEAKASSSKKDFLNYFQIALKSAHETQYWLIIIRESDSEFRGKTIELLNETVEISKIISSSILTMKVKRNL